MSVSTVSTRETAALVRRELARHADPAKAAFFVRYFKAGPGEYAEGDRFIGITVPIARRVAKAFWTLPRTEVLKLLRSRVHEERLVALLILEQQFIRARSDMKRREAIVKTYLANLKYVNHWDLVDCSSRTILGEFLQDRDRSVLYKLAESRNMWRRRVAIVSTWTFIRRGDCEDAIRLCRKLLKDPEDLIHKATGWMLREVGDRNPQVLQRFLDQHASVMPRTMLRYAIEKFSPELRRQYMFAR